MSKVSKKLPVVEKKNLVEAQKDDVNGSVIKLSAAIAGLLCILATVIFDKSQVLSGIGIAVIGLTIIICYAVYLSVNKKLTTQNMILLLFAAGFIIRLNYVLYTTLSAETRIRQHDLYSFGGDKGHSAYIEHFYNNGFTLPDFDPTTKSQFYHPPLHHFLAALWMRLLTTFGMSYDRAIGSIQFLTLFYSTCCMLVSERIFTKLNMRGYGKVLAVALIAFHPTFIILSGSINNDILSVLFILLSLYTTICWYKEPTLRNILMIALSVGLGMTTKLSVALVAPPIAVVFLIKFVSDKKKMFEHFGQFCVFGCVCLPLGLWFSVRNFVRFKVDFNYVPRLSDTSDQFVGFRSVFERLLDYSYNPFETVFLNRITTGSDYFEYNPFVTLIKTSMFGEYNYADTYQGITPFCTVLLVINVLLIAASIAAMVYCLIKKNGFMDRTMKIFFGFYHILLFVNFVIFSFQYPHTCSMDYRYIVPTCVIGAMFIGMLIGKVQEDYPKKSSVRKAIIYSLSGVTALFCLFSTVVYILLGV